MKRSFSSLLTGLAGYRLEGSGSLRVSGITADSRRVAPGMIFVAVPGHRQDGIRFVDEAVERGAKVVVSRSEPTVPTGRCAWLQVADPRESLSALAAAWYRHPSRRLQVAGITGTNGKTSVSFMVRHMLERHGMRCGLIGTVRYEIGARHIPARRTTPDAAEVQKLLHRMEEEGCRNVVMEVSSHALLQKRVADVRFRVAAFTNLSRDHLDYHRDMESYYRAKRILFESLAAAGGEATAVVNHDDPWGRCLCEDVRGVPVVKFGRDPARALDYTCSEVECDRRGIRFRLHHRGRRWPVRVPVPGEHNVDNCLTAIPVAAALGVPLDSVTDSLAALPPVPGRLEPVVCGQPFSVFIDYAHTPDGLERVLFSLRSMGFGRVHLLFGCGGNRDEGKRIRMGRIASRLADRIWITSDNPRFEDPARIVEQIAQGMNPPPDRIELDRRTAIEGILAQAREGDAVLIAGKGHETSQEIEGAIIPFEDGLHARRGLERIGYGPPRPCLAS